MLHLEVRQQQCGKLDAVVTSGLSFSKNVISHGGRVSGFPTPRSSLRAEKVQMPLPTQAQPAPSWEMLCPAAGPCPGQPSRVASFPSRRHQKERTVREAQSPPSIHPELRWRLLAPNTCGGIFGAVSLHGATLCMASLGALGCRAQRVRVQRDVARGLGGRTQKAANAAAACRVQGAGLAPRRAQAAL